ncbi:type IV pilus modification PilV family protein [Microbulbifer yueqingensis]|uniref:Type IV pilus modification protein PilV n=1 Tax=Microbulbifer yueqingensis TaxID=658219 RepID=A0A1G9AP97_9GAMM|nr:hypothetical protein [Microbulbifer yueqingensis]SDK29189.1 type IV pilus modification protein PilV [Microbulbifer yueqingensis]
MGRARKALEVMSQARGIGLIEVLIAMFVLAVGVLALGKLQGDFYGVSAASKARTEALAIAQGRLEEMRNYMHEAGSLAEFYALYPVGTDSNLAEIDGVNASFARKETIVANGQLRSVAVSVEWMDAAGKTQAVSLDTELAYTAPGAPGALAAVRNDFLVPSPTGRARLGEGTVPEGVDPPSNNDGTKMYIADGERKLVFGNKIVLTLEDACKADNAECLNFVRIMGRVYIDKATQGKLAPADVFVHASDAAFCTRYYFSSADEKEGIAIDKATSSDLLTKSGDYAYFHYTCYLGGGWHGNIGLLLSGGIKQTDKVCQGDPVSTNNWEAPVIAVRRAYRGMLYTLNDGGEPVTKEGVIAYKSHGIADGAVLGDSANGDHPHDFVISSLSADSTGGSNCISQGVMVRADATSADPGDLFAGNPDDFVCLNGDYLDSYASDKYGHDATCPFDPTAPPVERYIVRGSISVSANSGAAVTQGILDAIEVYTSDGPGNCLLSGFVNNQAEYECDVYDWGSGWNGMIYAEAPGKELELSCSPSPLELLSVKGDSSGNDIGCVAGNYALISGRVDTANENKVLASVAISGGSCYWGNAGLFYECITDSYDANAGGGWDGALTFTLSGGVTCPAIGTPGPLVLDGGVATATGISGKNALNIDIQNDLDLCP